MLLAVGDRLGPYEIAGLVGKGGMGEVYRAHDPRVQRDVAIKVSTEAFSDRSAREARAVAALNHPNICTLYDVGPNYLVMELVEGPTLADRIEQGALTLDEALPLARQIGSALEAAHEKGITHRDLKPGNVKIRADGHVKLLDFGLAKTAPPPSPPGEVSLTVNAETTAATERGVVLGTAAYMSPEQARGKVNIDKRTDIWAFGVLLYEMLTGRKPFRREDTTETLVAILTDQPDLSLAPAPTRRLIQRCLEKDPSQRLRDIGDAWDLLDGTGRETAPGARTRSTWLWPTTTIIAASTSAAFALLWWNTAPAQVQAVEFTLAEPAGSRFVNLYAAVAPSPDGRYVIIGATLPDSGRAGLWLRALDSLEARPLPGTETGTTPIWSPDSKSFAFFSNAEGTIKRIDIDGGAAPVVLADAAESNVSTAGTWNRDGVILHGGPDGLHRLTAAGGGFTLLTQANPGLQETGHGFPQFLSDGRRFLYFVASDDDNVQGVYAASLDAPADRRLILRTATKAVYAPPRAGADGSLLWLQGQTLIAQRFDPNSLHVSGDPVSVARGITSNVSAPIRAGYWADGGLLVYRPGEAGLRRAVLWWSAAGNPLGDVMPADSVEHLQLSPDGQRVAVSRKVGIAGSDIWLWELDRRVFTRLTFDEWTDALPVWSPDSREVAYVSFRTDGGQIYRKNISGTGSEEKLTEGATLKVPLDWSRDGKYLLYAERSGTMDIRALSLDGDRQPLAVAVTPANESLARISPDGRWIAYTSTESGRNEVYVRASPWLPSEPSGKWLVSTSGGNDPDWSADGRQVYYEAADGAIMAATVRNLSQGFRTDTPRVVLIAGHDARGEHSFDVTADGSRFMVTMPGEEGPAVPFVVLSNWQARLR